MLETNRRIQKDPGGKGTGSSSRKGPGNCVRKEKEHKAAKASPEQPHSPADQCPKKMSRRQGGADYAEHRGAQVQSAVAERRDCDVDTDEDDE